ncbi:MAG: hypothetical protein H6832_17635 [Planctomycetes bacterium]|nr:hypothetical protein [Planctomycetota bacterium]
MTKHFVLQRACVTLATTAALVATSCGYRSGFGNPHGIRSVAIQTVDDQSFRREIAALLTKRIGSDLTRYTGLVPGRHGSADAVLEVTVLSAPGRSVVEGDGGSIREGALALDARARLISRSGKVLSDRRYADWAEYRPDVGETRAGALDEAAADLARKILIGIDANFLDER